METTATSKGQIVIPVEIRKKLGITEGTRIRVELDAATNQIILKPITRESIARLRGKDRGKGVLKALMAERQGEKKQYGIKTGTKIQFIERDNELLLQPVTREFIHGLCGAYQSDISVTGELLKERERQKTRGREN